MCRADMKGMDKIIVIKQCLIVNEKYRGINEM